MSNPAYILEDIESRLENLEAEVTVIKEAIGFRNKRSSPKELLEQLQRIQNQPTSKSDDDE